ncbi:hypothetical protein BH11ACT8_BH11ACT8_33330 [soil metagenome]
MSGRSGAERGAVALTLLLAGFGLFLTVGSVAALITQELVLDQRITAVFGAGLGAVLTYVALRLLLGTRGSPGSGDRGGRSSDD